MEVKSLKIALVGPCLSCDFVLDLIGSATVDIDKKLIHNTDDVMFKLRFVSKRIPNNNNYTATMMYVNFSRVNFTNSLNTLPVRLQSKQLTISKTFAADNSGPWRLIYENYYTCLTSLFDVDLKFEIKRVPLTVCSLPSTFAPLKDTELVDFELHGDDGSVQIHSLALAASSPALRRMLEGNWKETQDKVLKVPGTSKATLQHLKDYIYLGVLPETGVEKLLQLASCYIMDGNEMTTEKCTTTIVSTLQADNATCVLKFALDNNLTKLYSTILECVQNGSLKVSDIITTP